MIQPRRRLDALAVAMLIVLSALWGVNQVAVKLAGADIPPLLQGAIRSAGSGLAVLLWALASGDNLFRRDGTLAQGILVGLLFGGEVLTLFLGIQLASASHTVLFLYTSPFFVALGTHLFVPGETLRLTQAAGLGLAFVGVGVAFADALDLASRKELTGDLLALLAAMLWAGATVLIKGGRLARANASKTLFYQLAVSAVLLAAASLVRGEDWAIRPSRLALACMAFQVVIVAWLSYHAWFWLVRHYPAGLLTAFTFLTPLFGVLAGGLLLRERLSGWLGAALALVSAGLYLVNRPPPVQPAPAGKTVPGA